MSTINYHRVLIDEKNLENLAAWNLYDKNLVENVQNILSMQVDDLSTDPNFCEALKLAILGFRNKNEVPF